MLRPTADSSYLDVCLEVNYKEDTDHKQSQSITIITYAWTTESDL